VFVVPLTQPITRSCLQLIKPIPYLSLLKKEFQFDRRLGHQAN
jgi:hypothetical protein